MTKGLILGKFNPMHLGHIGLIEFGLEHCDKLIVLVCASDKEIIPGSTRLEWVKGSFKNNSRVTAQLLNYSEQELPNTSVSSMEVSTIWASKLKTILPEIDIIFSSEDYGDYLAILLGCRHIMFDINRTASNISASQINRDVFKYWEFFSNSCKTFFR